MTKRVWLVTCMAICFFFIGFVSTAMAAPSLQWHTDRVYYETYDKIIIEGYFYNNGTQTITWVNWHNVKVFFKQKSTNWWLEAETTYRDLNVNVAPGESLRWNFRITDVAYNLFDYYDVKWTVNYQYE